MKKKNIIFIILVCFIVLLVVVFLSSRSAGKGQQDISKQFDACKLSSVDGEVVSVGQGTVSNFDGLRIGLKSIQDGKANFQIWNPQTNISSPTISLKPCESAEFGGYTYFLLSAKKNMNIFFRASGSGKGSINLFIKKQ